MKTEVISTKPPTPDEIKPVQLNVVLPAGLVKELKVIAAEEDATLSSLVLEGLLFVIESFHGNGGRWGHPHVDVPGSEAR